MLIIVPYVPEWAFTYSRDLITHVFVLDSCDIPAVFHGQ